MGELQLDHQIPLHLRTLAPKQVGGWERLKRVKWKKTWALRLDGYVVICCNTSSPNSMHLACQYHVKHSLQNCRCFLCRSWCVWLVAISPQPCLRPFSFFSWVPLLSWHPYFPLLPFHCVWRLCFHVLGSLLFLSMLHTPASCPCQFTCLLAFLACAHHPCPISVKGFTQNGRTDQALCPAFCPLYRRGPPVCFFLSLYTAVPLFLCLCPPLPGMAEPLLPCLSFMGPPGPDRCGGGGGDWRKALTAEKLSGWST